MNSTLQATDRPVETKADDLALTERERKFLKRMTSKYGNASRHPLLQSLLVSTTLVILGHLIERADLPWWGALMLVYIPALYLFSRYRRFGIFKSRLMCKLALREETDRERRTSS